jgi:hypothetical protein
LEGGGRRGQRGDGGPRDEDGEEPPGGGVMKMYGR